MADTANYGWTKPTVGGSEDTWGTILNTALDDIDTSLKTVSDAKQPLDSDLTAIAALSTTTFGRSLLTQASASALRTAAGLAIGSDVQAYSSNLDGWAAIATSTKQAANSNLTTLAGITPGATGLAILADTSGAAVRTEIGCGSIATRNLTVSTSTPSGGSDGDLWFQREA